MITLKIEGMTCEHCRATVAKALAGVAGVTAPPTVDLAQGEARIEGAADAAALIAAVSAEGYGVRAG